MLTFDAQTLHCDICRKDWHYVPRSEPCGSCGAVGQSWSPEGVEDDDGSPGPLCRRCVVDAEETALHDEINHEHREDGTTLVALDDAEAATSECDECSERNAAYVVMRGPEEVVRVCNECRRGA